MQVVEGEDGDELWIRAIVLSPDGALSVRQSLSGPTGDAHGVGTRLAKQMLADGAAELNGTPSAPLPLVVYAYLTPQRERGVHRER